MIEMRVHFGPVPTQRGWMRSGRQARSLAVSPDHYHKIARLRQSCGPVVALVR
jgi:hypothetical protein